MAIDRVMYVVNGLTVGGAETQVARLADGMVRRGKKVAVVSMIGDGPLSQQIIDSGAEIYSLNMRPGIPSPMAILRLRKIVKSFRPDVVHSHIVHANLLARVTRLIAKMPVLICTAHNTQEGGRALELGYRYTDRLADLTTNVSQAAVDRYVQIRAAPADRIRFVANGLDLQKFSIHAGERSRLRQELGLSENVFFWLAIGRLQEQKDYPNMLRAFKQTLENPAAANSVLMIAGTGPLEADIRAQIQSMGLDNKARLLGVRKDVPALMNAADAYLMSSSFEGMPLVLQEALACGLPVVSTRVGGNAEVAPEGTCSFLCDSGNDSALAKIMLQMIELPVETRRAMGQAGRNHVMQRYDLDRVLDEWTTIYTSFQEPKKSKSA